MQLTSLSRLPKLTAVPFLKQNIAVAIVGYRVYFEGDANVQVWDIDSAYQKLVKGILVFVDQQEYLDQSV